MDKYTFGTEYMAVLFLSEIEEDGDRGHIVKDDEGYTVYVEVSDED